MMVGATGLSGFIGRHLRLALMESDYSHLLLGRTSPLGPLDLADPDADWHAALDSANVVINLAGKAHDVSRATESQASGYLAVNALGAERVAKASAQVGARRFIQISTIKVLGDAQRGGRRFREDDPLRPRGVYAESKAEGERLVSAALAATDTECVILRLPLVFGTPFKGNLAGLEAAIRKGIPLPLGHRTIGRRSYVLMPDLMELLISIIESPGPLPPVLHARSADLTAAEVARMVGEEIERTPRIVSVPAPILRTGARAIRRAELASKVCDEMLVSDEFTRRALGLKPH